MRNELFSRSVGTTVLRSTATLSADSFRFHFHTSFHFKYIHFENLFFLSSPVERSKKERKKDETFYKFLQWMTRWPCSSYSRLLTVKCGNMEVRDSMHPPSHALYCLQATSETEIGISPSFTCVSL